jgi:acylphosphatase
LLENKKMKRRVKILVSGRVQGVCFRYFAQKKATKLGVTGYVKNLDDGRVELVAEAESLSLDTMIAWCHKGPVTARVDAVETIVLEVDDSLTQFEIR